MSDLTITATPAWRTAYPDTFVGFLVLDGVDNGPLSVALEERRRTLEKALRAEYGGVSRAELRARPTLQAYEAYYRRFQKTYHVQLQLESVAQKGKSIPTVSGLIAAMFMAELKNQLLTAGHDRSLLDPPLRLDLADGSEVASLANGQSQPLKPGDMYVVDQRGIISNVIYGPDRRTRIGDATRSVFFTVYGVPGISRDVIDKHLGDLAANVGLVCPAARVTTRDIVGGSVG